jgi:hypothetical protein
MICCDAEKPKLKESAMMLDWNEYRKQLAAGVKPIPQNIQANQNRACRVSHHGDVRRARTRLSCSLQIGLPIREFPAVENNFPDMVL